MVRLCVPGVVLTASARGSMASTNRRGERGPLHANLEVGGF